MALSIIEPVPTKDTLERFAALRSESISGSKMSAFDFARKWNLEQEAYAGDTDPAEPKYVRLAIEREHRLVQAVEVMGPLRRCRAVLGKGIRLAWLKWSKEAADWEIMGLLSDLAEAQLIQQYAPTIIRLTSLPKGTRVFGVPTSIPLTKLWVPTFRAMHEEALNW